MIPLLIIPSLLSRINPVSSDAPYLHSRTSELLRQMIRLPNSYSNIWGACT